METEIYLSIIIPAYREENRIHLILEAIADYQKQKNFAIETIVVIDGSPDKTKDVVLEFTSQIPNLKILERAENKGKGYSVREGMFKATGKFVLFADADNSTSIEQVDKLLEHIKTFPVVIGSCYSDGGYEAKPQPIYRVVGGRILNLIVRRLIRIDVKDTQCGFKLFRKQAAREIFERQSLHNFSFDVEILVIAKDLGYKVKEVGIIWHDNTRSTVKPFRDGIQMIKDAWIVRNNVLRKR